MDCNINLPQAISLTCRDHLFLCSDNTCSYGSAEESCQDILKPQFKERGGSRTPRLNCRHSYHEKMADEVCPYGEAFAECSQGQLTRTYNYYSQRRLLLEADQRGFIQELQEMDRLIYMVNFQYSRQWDELGPARQRRSQGRRLSAEWREELAPYQQQKEAAQEKLNTVVGELNQIATWALELDWRMRRI